MIKTYKGSNVKTKTIGQTILGSFEDNLNAFIKDKRIIDIKYAVVLGKNGYSTDRALVIYKEK